MRRRSSTSRWNCGTNTVVRDGTPAADFDRTKEFLGKYVNLLTKTKSAELGYAIDSLVYGIQNYNTYIRNSVAKLTREQVNVIIRKHLRTDRLLIVAVAANAENLKKQIIGAGPSTIQYNSAKPTDILAEDKIAGALDLGLRPQDIEIVPVAHVFE